MSMVGKMSIRKRALLGAALALALDAGMLIAGAAGITTIGDCGERGAGFIPMLIASICAIVFSGYAIFAGFRALKEPGDVTRVLTPVIAMGAMVLSVLVAYDVLTPPIVHCL